MAEKKLQIEDDKKIEFYDKLSDLYFERNFGTMSKSDFETFLFSEFIDNVGYVDGSCRKGFSNADDYTISKQLGITQSRVRALRERKDLKYPKKDPDWWKKEFKNISKNIKIEEGYVKLLIDDVNVLNEARHYIEVRGWFDECSLNKKLFKIPLGCYIELLSDQALEDLFTEDVKEKIENWNGKKEDKSLISNFLNEMTHETANAFFRNATKNAITYILQMILSGVINSESIKNVTKLLD